MALVSESECLNCEMMAICVYLISGRHYTDAIADQKTGKCTARYWYRENHQGAGFKHIDHINMIVDAQGM